jgi:hypothetical protein
MADAFGGGNDYWKVRICLRIIWCQIRRDGVDVVAIPQAAGAVTDSSICGTREQHDGGSWKCDPHCQATRKPSVDIDMPS